MSADRVEAITYMVYAPWAGHTPRLAATPVGPPGLADLSPRGELVTPSGWPAPWCWPSSLTTLLRLLAESSKKLVKKFSLPPPSSSLLTTLYLERPPS